MTHMSSSLPESLVSKTQNVLCIFDSHLLLRYLIFTQIIIENLSTNIRVENLSRNYSEKLKSKKI